ncbi:MAG: glycosyltransferase [Candidatus Shapirobacteria bacterium]
MKKNTPTINDLIGDYNLTTNHLSVLSSHKKNLEFQYNQILNAKAFKIWQKYKSVKSFPIFIKSVFAYLYKNRSHGLGAKLNSYNLRAQHQQNVQNNYTQWFSQNYPTVKLLQSQKKHVFKYQPLVSILTPVFNTDQEFLVKCIESVQNQSYSNWELCIADDCSTLPQIHKILNDYSKKDKRIKVVFRPKNGHISNASNSALQIASGEFIALLDHDDEIWPNALFEIVKLLNESPQTDFIYTDEDKIEMDGNHSDPFFKPDWSLNLLLSTNYITHFSVIRKSLVDKIKGFRVGYEGSQDYDLFLRIVKLSQNILHIPTILYSWRKVPNSTASEYSVKSYAHVSAKKALTSYLKSKNIHGSVEEGLKLGTFKIKYSLLKKPLVSIIIPTKDKVELLKKCVHSIKTRSTYPNYEIIIIDTGSTEKPTLRFLKNIGKQVTVIKHIEPEFNFSKTNNFATEIAKGDYFLFLNNDTEVTSPNWIEEMLLLAQLPTSGPVGAKLLYPNHNIQHAGIEMLGNFWPHHFSINYPDLESYGFPCLNYKDVTHNPTAVTGACLLISKPKFNKLGGFDENYPLEFQDVILSLKARSLGLLPVYTPYAKLIHHESQTIKNERSWNRTLIKFEQFKKEYSKYISPFNPNIEHIEQETKQAKTYIDNSLSQPIILNQPVASNKEKILVISHLYWPSIGGGEKLFQTLAEKLTDNFDVTVLTSNVTSTDYYFKSNSNSPALSQEYLNNVKILRANVDPRNSKYLFLHKLGKKFPSLWFNLTPMFFGPYFFWNDIKVLLKQDFKWVICGPTPTSTLLYGWLFKKFSKAKLAVIPCMHTEDKLHTSRSALNILKQADVIFTLTNNENKFLESRGVTPNKITTIGVGVDDYLLTTPKQTSKIKDYILYLGQEGAHKNIPLLINSMVRIWKQGFKNKLVIAGARSSYSPIIDQQIESLSPIYKKNIIRMNNISNNQKVELLDNCLLLVNPSSYESFGIVFIEAWARKKPVIGANIPAVSQLITDNNDGFLFVNKKINSLINILEYLINNKIVASNLGTNGKEKVLNKFYWPTIINHVYNYLK